MSPIQIQYRQSVYDKQHSDVTLKTLDNIIEGLKPKSSFEVQITRFCCILLAQIKEMNSTSDDIQEQKDTEVKTEPLVYEIAQPSGVGFDDKSQDLYDVPFVEADTSFLESDVDEIDLSMNVDVYKDGYKSVVNKGFHYDNCKF